MPAMLLLLAGLADLHCCRSNRLALVRRARPGRRRQWVLCNVALTEDRWSRSACTRSGLLSALRSKSCRSQASENWNSRSWLRYASSESLQAEHGMGREGGHGFRHTDAAGGRGKEGVWPARRRRSTEAPPPQRSPGARAAVVPLQALPGAAGH